MEFEGERDDVVWVGPDGEETACFARGTAGDARRFEDRDAVLGGVVGGVPREEVGCCAANDSGACSN